MSTVREDVESAMRELSGTADRGDDGDNWTERGIIRFLREQIAERERERTTSEDFAESLFSAAFMNCRREFGDMWAPERELAMRDQRRKGQRQ